MEYDRRILVLDGPGGPLQSLALDLSARGFAVHYANDPDEALLIARETGDRLGAVVFDSTAVGPASGLAARLGVPPGALIPTGSRPPEREIAALASHGVRWHPWDEPAGETLRFVLATVLSEHDPMELRFHPRVPLRAPGMLEVAADKGEVTLQDVSPGGACLMGSVVGAATDRGTLRFALDGTPLVLPVRLVWTVDGCEDGVGVAGVAFTEVDPAAGRSLDRTTRSVMASRRVLARHDGTERG